MNLQKIKKLLPCAFFTMLALLLGSQSRDLCAQVKPAALRSPFSLTVGGTVSGFAPDYVPNKLIGAGAYVDVNIFHGIGVEAEGRWQRFNSYQNITQDNYLIGPRVKVLSFWKARPYVKVLGGFSTMNFEQNVASGRFSTLAGGGGIDLQLTRRITIRAVDAEYQWWPKFLGGNLKPYGVSVGVGYRVF